MTTTKKMIDQQEVFDFLLTCPENTAIYLGADSERWRDKTGKWWATYYTVCVVHIGSSKGCRIFAEEHRERDFDQKAAKPSLRMNTEAQMIAGLYSRIENAILATGFEVSIHLDINPNEEHGSNCAAASAVGYIKAMTNIEPELKPNAFAASYAADRGADFLK